MLAYRMKRKQIQPKRPCSALYLLFQGTLGLAAAVKRLCLVLVVPTNPCRWTAAVLKRLEAFSAPDLCNVMWGMARMGCKDSELFAMCSPVLLPLLDRVTVPELCDVAWAYAAAEHHDYQLMERIAAEVGGG